MKHTRFLVLFFVLISCVSVFGQTSKKTKKSANQRPKAEAVRNPASGYYLILGRPICCFLSTKEKNAAIKNLNANAIAVSFGYPDMAEYRGKFPMAKKIDRKNKVLLIGPFTTESQALGILSRLSNLLPKDEGMAFSLTDNAPYGWRIGLYDISGFKIK